MPVARAHSQQQSVANFRGTASSRSSPGLQHRPSSAGPIAYSPAAPSAAPAGAGWTASPGYSSQAHLHHRGSPQQRGMDSPYALHPDGKLYPVRDSSDYLGGDHHPGAHMGHHARMGSPSASHAYAPVGSGGMRGGPPGQGPPPQRTTPGGIQHPQQHQQYQQQPFNGAEAPWARGSSRERVDAPRYRDQAQYEYAPPPPQQQGGQMHGHEYGHNMPGPRSGSGYPPCPPPPRPQQPQRPPQVR